MTLSQQALIWTLRALLLWALVETAGWVYAEGARWVDTSLRVAGHEDAMRRLGRQADRIERDAVAAEAAATARAGAQWPVTPRAGESLDAATARVLREELSLAGAQAPMVEPAEAPGVYVARWREPPETAPRALHMLARRAPQARLERLVMMKSGAINVEARLRVLAQPTPVAEAAR